jgi:hypothetical protein
MLSIFRESGLAPFYGASNLTYPAVTAFKAEEECELEASIQLLS